MSNQIEYEYNGNTFKIDEVLAYQLDSIAYNIKNDWDFVIMVSGDRKVRVGKSVLAMQICSYLHYAIKKLGLNDNAYTKDNVFFENANLIKTAQIRPQYSIIHYDEGREGLASIKAMKSFQQDLIDFFTECGQLNHVFVIVCPDFFELNENIAVGRSEFLINVYRREDTRMMDIYKDGTKRPITILKRGQFEFFSRPAKQLLFEIAKNTRRKSYNHIKPDHKGTFSHYYTIDEQEYKQLKKDALTRFNKRHEEKKERKLNVQRDQYIINRYKEGAKTKEIHSELEKYFEIMLSEDRIRGIRLKNKENKHDSV